MPVFANENNQNRLKSFKNKGKDEGEMRRRRNEVTIELRKAKRDNQILKRRNISKSELTPLKEIENNNNVQPSAHTISQILSSETSRDKIFLAVQATRKLLSRERNPPIDEVIQAGLVPQLVECLKQYDSPDIQFEAAWALTNIASGSSEQTWVVVNEGALKFFVDLLSSPNQKVCEQAVWAIGNIAGDGSKLRDKVLNDYGVIKPLLTLIQQSTEQASFLRNITWTLSNLCRNKNPPPPFFAVQQLLPALAYLITFNDKEVVADACWALSYITDGPNEKIQAVIDSNVLPSLVSLLGAQDELNILTPALRAVGNVVTGTESQTQNALDLGALKHFGGLLTHKKASLIKEAAWALSNITAGSDSQIQAVIDAQLIPVILNVMDQGDYKSQKEAVWVITNFTSGSNSQQIRYLVEECMAIPYLCKLLTVKEPKVILVLLDSFKSILAKCDKMGILDDITNQIEECSGLDKIEILQEHENEQVYQDAQALIEKYFETEDETELDMAPPTNGAGFKFGTPKLPESGFRF